MGEARKWLAGAHVPNRSFAFSEAARAGNHQLDRSADGTARISEWGSGKTLHVLKHEKGVRRVLFSPDGKLLVTATSGT